MPSVSPAHPNWYVNQVESYAFEAVDFIKSFRKNRMFNFAVTPKFMEDFDGSRPMFTEFFQSKPLPDFPELRAIFNYNQFWSYFVSVKSEDGVVQFQHAKTRSGQGLNNPHPGIQISQYQVGQFGPDVFSSNGWDFNQTSEFSSMLEKGWGAEFMNGPMIALFTKFGEIDKREFIQGKTLPRRILPNRAGQQTVVAQMKTLSSSWLNHVVVTGEVGVRGHFRLQPYGEGRSEVKLIYIKPHTRGGYSKAADRWREMPTEEEE